MVNKIDPIGFACLISKVAAIRGEELYSSLVEDFHVLALNSVMEQSQQTVTVPMFQVDDMLKAISENRKIDAIRAYRAITGSGLKEAKDAIERYWYSHRLDEEIKY